MTTSKLFISYYVLNIISIEGLAIPLPVINSVTIDYPDTKHLTASNITNHLVNELGYKVDGLISWQLNQ